MDNLSIVDINKNIVELYDKLTLRIREAEKAIAEANLKKAGYDNLISEQDEISSHLREREKLISRVEDLYASEAKIVEDFKKLAAERLAINRDKEELDGYIKKERQALKEEQDRIKFQFDKLRREEGELDTARKNYKIEVIEQINKMAVNKNVNK